MEIDKEKYLKKKQIQQFICLLLFFGNTHPKALSTVDYELQFTVNTLIS